MKHVDIWTDGACSGNPGKGGWAAILEYQGTTKSISGGNKQTTNNQMELTAVIEALKALKLPCKVKLRSDSAYVVNAFLNNWIEKWQANGWRSSKKGLVANKELWEELIALTQIHEVEFVKVQGHAFEANNNMCDSIARSEILKL